MSNACLQHKKQKHDKLLIVYYVGQLVVRAALFVACIIVGFLQPEQLNIKHAFALNFDSLSDFLSSISFALIVLVVLLLDMVTKIMPRSGISLGSRKQFKRYHVPTAQTFAGGAFAFRDYISHMVRSGEIMEADARKLALERAVKLSRQNLSDALSALGDAKDDALLGMKHLVQNVRGLQGLPYEEQDLIANNKTRNAIRASHAKQVLPVAVIWVVGNIVAALVFSQFGLLTPQFCLLWCLFYFLSDMICVVFWCPFQLFLMKNRCCVTCHIFNWDAIMAVTPLFFCPSSYSLLVIIPALLILLLWEVTFYLFPERFDERANASLLCMECGEELCKYRGKFQEDSRAE